MNNDDIDVYKDIHKGIRAELFAVTATAGHLDAGDDGARAAFADRVDRLHGVLTAHAEHEDGFLQPLIEVHTPHLADGIVAEHAFLDSTISGIRKASAEARTRRELHEIYLDLSTFTGAYLSHQAVEEREVHPALLAAVGPEVLLDAHHRLLATIPPAEMAEALSLMLPAMNLDDRAEMLGGMRLDAPPEVFAGVCALAESVLLPPDMAALGRRLGLS